MRMGVPKWLADYHRGVYWSVLLDGQDVTTGCTFADEEAGGVVHLKPNARGQSDTYQRFGRVQIVRKNV